jgi:hypothetical protein
MVKLKRTLVFHSVEKDGILHKRYAKILWETSKNNNIATSKAGSTLCESSTKP